jgi:C-terminal peptidase prc
LQPLSNNERIAIFERVWSIVNERYLYEDFNGQDWDAVRAEFEPRVTAAAGEAEFYELMYELIARLGDDHSRFQSPQDVAEEEARFTGNLVYGGIGAIVRETDDGGLILTVARDSPAEQAGLQRFDLITEIDGIPFIDPVAFGPEGPIGSVRGIPGTTVMLTIQREGRSPREVAVVRQAVPRNAFPDVEGERLEDSAIGLVRIYTFNVDNLDQLVEDAIRDLLAEGPLDGLIIDVRSNGGGRVNLMLSTIGLFVDGGVIGSTAGRGSSSEQTVPTDRIISELEGVPMAVLIGPNTASAAEMFAAGMRVLGRASIVGLPSAGNTENLFPYNFDDGSRLWLAQVAYQLPDGNLIEGVGVLPDREIEAEWWRYNAADDPQVTVAIEELRQAAQSR